MNKEPIVKDSNKVIIKKETQRVKDVKLAQDKKDTKKETISKKPINK